MNDNPEQSAHDSTGDTAAHELTEAAPACPACGATARRAGSHFCATCGRDLGGEGYLPADALRSSYYYQQRRLPVTLAPTPTRPVGTAASRASTRKVFSISFDGNENRAARTALAFVTYALVPYLGILFCPGALLMGSVGYLRARRTPYRTGGRASFISIMLGLLLLAAQLFLWWLLYKVPEWTGARG
jgi:hypothetical protein